MRETRTFARAARRIILVIDAIVIGAVLVAGALLSGVWTYSRTAAGQARLAHLAERAVRDKVPGARLGGLGTTRDHDVVLSDLNLFDPTGMRAVHIDRVLVHPHWAALLHGRIDLDRVRVEGLAVDARQLPDGRLNLTALVPPSPAAAPKRPAPAPSPAWSVRRFELVGRAELHQPEGLIALPSLMVDGHANAAQGRTTIGLDEVRAELQLPERPVVHIGLAGHAVLDGPLIDATVGELRIAGLLPDDVVVHATVGKDHDRVQSGGSAHAGATGEASWTAAVTLAPSGLGAYSADVDVDRLRFDRLPLVLPPGHLSATLSAKGSGVPLQPGTTAAITAMVRDSEVAGYRIEDATVRASTEGERWMLRECATHVAGVAAHVSGAGVGASGKAQVTLDLNRPTARGAALAPALPITGRGHLAATVEGHWPNELRFHLRGGVTRLAVARQLSIATARVDLDGAATQHRAWSLVTQGRADVARLASAALSVNDAKLSFSTRGSLEAPTGTLSARATAIAVAPAGLHLDTASVDAHGNAGNIAVAARAHGADGDVDLQANVRRRRDTLDLALTRLGLDLHHKAVRQKVMLANPATVHLQTAEDEVKIAGLHVVAQGTLASGEILIDGDVKGPGRGHRAPAGHVVLGLRHASAASVPPLDANVTFDVADARARADLKVKQSPGGAALTGQLDVPLERAGSALGWKLATAGRLQATIDSSNVELSAIAPLQHVLSRWGLTGGNFHIHAAASGDMRDPQASLSVNVRRLEYRDVTGDGRDARIHHVPGVGLSIDLGTAPKRLRASTKVFLYDGGFVTANADWGIGLAGLLAGADLRQVPLDATVELPRFQIAAFRSLSDQLQDTSGWLSGHGRITGTLARPRGTVDVTLADARLDQIRLGLLAAHAESDGHTVHATLRLPTNGVRSGLLQARADLTRGPAPRLDATLDMTGVDPGFVRPLVPGLRELGGVLDAHVVAQGQWPKPALSGKVYYYGGRVGLVGEPTFTNVGVAIALSPGHVQVQSLQAYSGGGSVGGKGDVTLDGLQVTTAALTAHAHRFVLAAAGISGSRLDGDLTLTMGRTDSTLNGEAHVPDATVWLPGLSVNNKHPQRITPHDDVRFVDGASRAAQQRDAAAAKQPPTRLNLKARGDTIFVRAKDLDLEAETELSLRTTAKGDDALFGTIHIRRGRINISGQPFQLDDGRVLFDGGASPRLDLHLTHAYTDTTVTVDLRGTAAKPELHFRSDPPIYNESQIVSLVLTGKAGGGPPGGPSPDPTSVIATTVLATVADKLAPQLGLDVFKVEKTAPPPDQPNAQPGLLAERVEVGKYVSERVYVSYAHVFGATETQNTNEATAEYHISPRWLAQTVFGDAGVGGFDAFWTWRY